MLTAEERSRDLAVRGAALVLADPACSGGERRFPDGIERFLGHEDHELALFGAKRRCRPMVLQTERIGNEKVETRPCSE
mgnify:CR=1 FL=1